MKVNALTTFYIVRHGEAEGNKEGIILGPLDLPLTPNGIAQAEALAETLKDIHFDAAFSSVLQRAMQTANIFAKRLHLAVIPAHDLKERFVGCFQGRGLREVQSELKNKIVGFEELNNKEKLDYRFAADIESGNQAAQRLISFLINTTAGNQGKCFLVVTHTAIIGNFLVHLGLIDYQGLFGNCLENTGFLILRTDGIKFFVDEITTTGTTRRMDLFKAATVP